MMTPHPTEHYKTSITHHVVIFRFEVFAEPFVACNDGPSNKMLDFEVISNSFDYTMYRIAFLRILCIQDIRLAAFTVGIQLVKRVLKFISNFPSTLFRR